MRSAMTAGGTRKELEKLKGIDYIYDEERNQFV